MDNAITELLKKMQSALTDLQKEAKSLKDAQNSNNKGEHAYKRASYQPNNRTSIKCFGCGKTGHLKKICTVKRSNPNQTKDKRSNANQITVESSDSPRTITGTIGVNKLASEAGVFIRVKVNGVNANMLIDTGATVTLISNDLFKKIENPLIPTMNREFLSASGSALQITGKNHY